MGVNTSARVRAVLDAIRRIVQALRASGSAAERTVGLSGAQLFVLQRLAGAEGLSLNELAALTFTHQSSVSVVVSRLVERGLVARRAAADDRRRAALSLTARGRALVARAPATAAQDRLIAAVERLAAARQAMLCESLGSLVSAMELPGKAPEMFFEEVGRRRRGASVAHRSAAAPPRSRARR